MSRFLNSFFVTLDITQKLVITHPADRNPAGVLNSFKVMFAFTLCFRTQKHRNIRIPSLCLEALRLTQTVKSTKRSCACVTRRVHCKRWNPDVDQSERSYYNKQSATRLSEVTSVPSQPIKDLVYATRHVRVYLQQMGFDSLTKCGLVKVGCYSNIFIPHVSIIT